MRKEIKVTSLEELEELEIKYNLEDCGNSGKYNGWKWLVDDENEVDVYFKLLED